MRTTADESRKFNNNSLRRHTFTIVHAFPCPLSPLSPISSSYGTKVIMFGIRSCFSAGALLGLALVTVKAQENPDKRVPTSSGFEADCKLPCGKQPEEYKCSSAFELNACQRTAARYGVAASLCLSKTTNRPCGLVVLYHVTHIHT